jgi:MraZ protein
MLPEYVKFMAEIDAFKDRRQADKFRKQLDASPVEMDGQNRILIPKKLLDYAGLTTEVVYTPGRGRSLEMWNPERFNAQTSMKTDEDQQSFNDIYYQIGSSEGLDDKR